MAVAVPITSAATYPAPSWLPLAAFALLFSILLIAELVRPLHREPIEGKGRLATNFGLGIIGFLLAAVLPVTSVAAAEWARVRGFGLLHAFDAPLHVAIAATIALRSLAQYGIHRLSHAWPFLWRVHRIHHCDTAVDLSTGFRNHPLELLVILIPVCGLALLAGFHVPTLAAYETVAFAFALWTHANLHLPRPVDRVARQLIVTPQMHHVHHSSRVKETDSNFGDVLSLWDRLFGTYAAVDDNELRALRFGLGQAYDVRAARFGEQLLLPLRPEPDARAQPSRARSRSMEAGPTAGDC
jgi:sterol desaturase/sphingolipid hydroxylase (fatty acid hydroxylase superfamily)